MEYLRFGRSNLMVSRLSLGAMGFGDRSWRGWVLDDAASRAVVKRALDDGINLFDTCDFYSAGESERILGRALVEYAPRDEIVLATKVGMPMGRHANARGFSRKHVMEGIDASLDRLGTDYVDLYQTHIWDPSTDLEELVDAFGEVVRAGKARYIGVTTLPAWVLAKTRRIADEARSARFVSMQCEYNLCHREAERELVPLCMAEGMAMIPFSPFARGFLCADRREQANRTARTETDDYTHRNYYRDGDFAVLEAVARIAARRGLAPAQVALAWVLRQPGITSPIFGATSEAHVDVAVATLGVRLEDEDLDELEGLYQPRPTRGGGGH